MTALCLVALASCKEEEEPELTPVGTPAAALYSSTVSSLTFYWDKIEHASQYAYELYGPDEELVNGGVTSAVTASFSRLKDNTTYTLKVWAYSAYGSEYDKSEVVTITATTPAIVKLNAPVLSIEQATEADPATISWEAVKDAEYYRYSYYNTETPDDAVTGTTEETGLTLDLKTGTYKFCLSSCNDAEAFSESDQATISLTFVKPEKFLLWSRKGTFSDGGDGSWDATLEAYTDSSYVLKSWYGAEGYDLEFTVNKDSTINVTNYYADKYPDYIYVATGTDAGDGWAQLYTSDGYSNFNGNRCSGMVWFYNYITSQYATFRWTTDSFIDGIVGTYRQKTTGQEAFNTGEWQAMDATNLVTIAKVDDSTVTVTGIVQEANSVLTATVDSDAKTLYFAPQADWLQWYTFCKESDINTGVTATYADGAFTLSGWTAYYGGDYIYDAVTLLY